MSLNQFINEAQLRTYLLADKESERLEFKEAKQDFSYEGERNSVLSYCVALENEGGGKLILRVSDKLPRKIVGTNAFKNIDRLTESPL